MFKTALEVSNSTCLLRMILNTKNRTQIAKSVPATALNAHIWYFRHSLAHRRRKKTTDVFSDVSRFCWVFINICNPFYHSNCVTAP